MDGERESDKERRKGFGGEDRKSYLGSEERQQCGYKSGEAMQSWQKVQPSVSALYLPLAVIMSDGSPMPSGYDYQAWEGTNPF
ncbi:hypothetical protein SRHO_G00244350 [Serrasalmus rhombeus]